jgi:hypothetical protein
MLDGYSYGQNDILFELVFPFFTWNNLKNFKFSKGFHPDLCIHACNLFCPIHLLYYSFSCSPSLGVVSHTCNPSSQDRDRRILSLKPA